MRKKEKKRLLILPRYNSKWIVFLFFFLFFSYVFSLKESLGVPFREKTEKKKRKRKKRKKNNPFTSA